MVTDHGNISVVELGNRLLLQHWQCFNIATKYGSEIFQFKLLDFSWISSMAEGKVLCDGVMAVRSSLDSIWSSSNHFIHGRTNTCPK